MSWIYDIWQMILVIVNAVGTSMDDLVTRLDSVQFTEDLLITKFLATIRYIAGTPVYLLFVTMIYIGAGFIIWKLIKIVINAVSSVTPGLKGKVKVE